MAHKVFEAGLKRFMHEPVYILEWVQFLVTKIISYVILLMFMWYKISHEWEIFHGPFILCYWWYGLSNITFPLSCCRYADFLSRLNDDRNIRALFERALSSLPPEESVEVKYTIFWDLMRIAVWLWLNKQTYLFVFVA